MRTDANTEALNRFLAEEDEWLRSRPICAECGEPIQSEYAYEIELCHYICEDCLEEYLNSIRVDAESLVDDGSDNYD